MSDWRNLYNRYRNNAVGFFLGPEAAGQFGLPGAMNEFTGNDPYNYGGHERAAARLSGVFPGGIGFGAANIAGLGNELATGAFEVAQGNPFFSTSGFDIGDVGANVRGGLGNFFGQQGVPQAVGNIYDQNQQAALDNQFADVQGGASSSTDQNVTWGPQTVGQNAQGTPTVGQEVTVTAKAPRQPNPNFERRANTFFNDIGAWNAMPDFSLLGGQANPFAGGYYSYRPAPQWGWSSPRGDSIQPQPSWSWW